MSDYTPLFKPGQAVTSTASAAITGGKLLIVTGSGTVGPGTAASPAWVGVAAQDAASGAPVGYFSGGVQRILASGAVIAGDLVVAGAAGTVASIAAIGAAWAAADIANTRAIVGVALTTGTDVLVEIKMEH